MKVCFIAVCYNAEQDAVKLLESIEQACESCAELVSMELKVVLADNSDSTSKELSVYDSRYYDFQYIKFPNLGYFPAFNKAFNLINSECGTTFDYVIVSNVDLVVDSSFFRNLIKLRIDNQCGVIAPSIVSKSTGHDINPKIIERVSLSKLKILRLLFRNPRLFSVYNGLSHLKSKWRVKDKSTVDFESNYHKVIYAPHGSLVIFTQHYFSSGGSINYPRFLFGEEVFIAEEVLNHKLKVVHVEELVVYDDEHGSTSKVNSSFIAREHAKSYDYLIDNYFSG